MAERADRIIEGVLTPLVRLILWVLDATHRRDQEAVECDDPVGAHEDTF
jgi:hypothetical protein